MAQETAMGYKNGQLEILELIEAGYPLISVVTDDETPVIKTLVEIAENVLPELKYEVITWNVASGFYCEHGSNVVREFKTKEKAVDEKIDALYEYIAEIEGNTIFVLQDFDYLLSDIKYAGLKLKEVVQTIMNPTKKDKLQKRYANGKKKYKKNIIMLSASSNIPIELEKMTNLVYFGMPGKDEIGDIVDVIDSKQPKKLSEEEREKIIKASLGLTEPEVENALWKSIASSDRMNVKSISSIKEQIVKKGGIVEFIKLSDDNAEVGGMKNLFEYVSKRVIAFDDEIRLARKLPFPKGLLLTGIQGCGKSHSVKAIAHFLDIPLVRLDMGSLMDKFVGNSEKNLKKVINLVESISPVILWIDEIEKGFPNPQSANTHEVSNRILSTILTWLQEKTTPVFVMATANNIDNLPPELIRKGRFDELFFIDLPNERERKDIFEIFLKKVDVEKESVDVAALVCETHGYSGAEIESLVNEANFQSAADNSPITTEYLMKEISKTTPLSVIRKDKLDSIREWASVNNVRPANE